MASNIEAGGAFIRISGKDATGQTLKKVQTRLKSFAVGASKIGGAFTGIGGAITAPFLAAAKTFASTGDELDKMAARTGASVESLSELGFAAGRSGAQLSDVEGGFRGMAKTLAGAQKGLKTSVEKLDDLGLSVKQLENLTPDERFELIADRISQIQDPTIKAAKAMEIFGRSGSALLPMFNGGAKGIKELREEAKRLGVTMSTDDATAAAKLTDAIGDMQDSFGGLVRRIGGAVAGPLTDFFNLAAGYVSTASNWAGANSQVLSTIAGVGIGLVGLGSVLGGVAIAAYGVNVAIGLMGTILGVLSSPFVLIGAAIAGAAVAFFTLTETGQNVASSIGSTFQTLVGNVTSFVSGIVNAIKSGNFSLAGEIAMTGLQLAFGSGLEVIRGLFIKVLGGIASLFGTTVDDIAQSIGGLVKKIQSVVAKLNELRVAATNKISAGIGALVGVDTSPEQQQATQNAKAFTASVDAIDPKAIGKKLTTAIDTDSLKDKLKELIKTANAPKQDTTTTTTAPPTPGPMSIEMPEGIGEAVKSSIQTIGGTFSAAAAARLTNVKSFDQEIASNSKDQVKLLRQIHTAILAAPGATFS